jgi:hypothetical protein
MDVGPVAVTQDAPLQNGIGCPGAAMALPIAVVRPLQITIGVESAVQKQR